MRVPAADELLDYLRKNDFKPFIVSGGGIDLIRAVSEEAYSIPREQVIGSSLKTRVDTQNGIGRDLAMMRYTLAGSRAISFRAAAISAFPRPLRCGRQD